MNKKTKELMHRLELCDKNNYFLFQRFYRNPSEVLGGSDEWTIDHYQDYGEIKQLVFNESFFDLMNCLFDYNDWDSDFSKKLDINLLRKLRFLCYDTINFRKNSFENYIEDLHDEYLRKFCKNEVPIGHYAKKYNIFELSCIVEHFNKYGWLYELGINQERIDEVNVDSIRELMNRIGFEIDFYYEKYVKPIEEQKAILERIENENYEEDNCLFLMDRKGEDKKSINALVCCNEFLEKINNTLLQKRLPKTVIENIINILSISIKLKTHILDVEYDEESVFRYLCILEEERIKNFNYKEAERLISLLIKKLGEKSNCKLTLKLILNNNS